MKIDLWEILKSATRSGSQPDGQVNVILHKTMKYFAYGSNMYHEQMNERCPGNKFLGRAILNGYKFVFDGYSRKWKGAVANAIVSPENAVWGGLFEISEANRAALDCYEGFPDSYNRTNVNVLIKEEIISDVLVYCRIGEKISPANPEYRKIVLQGAKDCSLPESYIKEYLSAV